MNSKQHIIGIGLNSDQAADDTRDFGPQIDFDPTRCYVANVINTVTF